MMEQKYGIIVGLTYNRNAHESILCPLAFSFLVKIDQNVAVYT